jgi:AraC-like DNA-binding protein
MAKSENPNRASYWSDSTIEGLEFLSAEYTSHEFAPHSHDSYSIGLVQSGALSFKYRSPSDVVPAGNIMIIHPGEVHTGKCIGDQGCVYRMMYIKPEILRDGFSELYAKPPLDLFFRAQNILDRDLARTIFQVHRSFENATLMVFEKESKLMTLMARLISRHASPRLLVKPLRTDKSFVKKAKRFLEDRYDENVSLKDLAREVNISPYHLLRVFESELGIPPYAYLTQIRIQESKRLLSNGVSIADVAQQTGFCDQSQFTKRFKQIVGTTPGLFIKNQQ